jgi:hypothetical protein
MPYRSPYRRRPSSDLAADPEFLKGRAAGLLGIPGDMINLVGRDLPAAMTQDMPADRPSLIGGPYQAGPPIKRDNTPLPPFSERVGTSDYIAKQMGADPNSLKTQAGILAGLNPASLLKAAPLLATKLSKGSGLLDDATRLKRAKDMGFNVDQTQYHGTHAKNINKFDDSYIGNRDEGFFGRGHYFTTESGEASYYGPNVGEYFTRGKILDLSPNKTNSDFLLEDKKYFKFWTKELDKLDMLDEPTQKGLKTINKIDDYVDTNVKVMKGKNSNGTDGFTASVKHPTRKPYVFKDANGKKRSIDETLDSPLFNRGDGVEFYETKEKAIKALKNRIIYEAEHFGELKTVYPDVGNILYSLSDYIRVGGKGAAELTKQAKKAGYDGIRVGDETVIFDPKNIRSKDAVFDPKKTDSSDLTSNLLGQSKPPMRSLLA